MSGGDIPSQAVSESRGNRARIILLSIVGAPICLALFLKFATVPRHRTHTHCDMHALGSVFRIYAKESEGGRWPGLAQNGRVWSPDLAEIYPGYFDSPSMLVSGHLPNREAVLDTLDDVLAGPNPDYDTAAGLMGLSYAYLGYAVMDEADFGRLAKARATGQLDGGDGLLADGESADSVLPLQEGVERFFLTGGLGPEPTSAAQGLVPVMVEIARWKHRNPDKSFHGTEVLYMDGHVAFVPLGTFPVVPGVMDVLSGMAPAQEPAVQSTPTEAAT